MRFCSSVVKFLLGRGGDKIAFKLWKDNWWSLLDANPVALGKLWWIFIPSNEILYGFKDTIWNFFFPISFRLLFWIQRQNHSHKIFGSAILRQILYLSFGAKSDSKKLAWIFISLNKENQTFFYSSIVRQKMTNALESSQYYQKLKRRS